MPIRAPERGIDIPLDKSNIARTADKMMEGMMRLFHPRANRVLAPHLCRDMRTQAEFEREVSPEETAVFENVRNWLIARLEQLELGALDNGQLILNPWNETDGLGLQSVSVGVNRLVSGANRRHRVPKILPVLLPGELKHPTIGVIAKGMLYSRFSQVQGSLASFGVANGRVEELTAMSDEFHVGVVVPVFSEGDEQEFTNKYVLNAGETMTVAGPDAVQVCIEQPADPGVVGVGQDVNEAVYACAFKNSDQRA